MHHKKKGFEAQFVLSEGVSTMKATLDTEAGAPSYLNIFRAPAAAWTKSNDGCDPPKLPPVLVTKVPAPTSIPPVPYKGTMPPPPEPANDESKEMQRRLVDVAPSYICKHAHDLSVRGERSLCMCVFTYFKKFQTVLNESTKDKKAAEVIDAVIKQTKESFFEEEIYTKEGVCFFYIIARALIRL